MKNHVLQKTRMVPSAQERLPPADSLLILRASLAHYYPPAAARRLPPDFYLPMLSRSLLAVALVASCVPAFGADGPGDVDFVRDVQPILTTHCVECHGPTKQENGLRLDHGDAITRGGDSGRA